MEKACHKENHSIGVIILFVCFFLKINMYCQLLELYPKRYFSVNIPGTRWPEIWTFTQRPYFNTGIRGAEPAKSTSNPGTGCPKPATFLRAQGTASEAPGGPAHKGAFSPATLMQGSSATHPNLREHRVLEFQAWSPPATRGNAGPERRRPCDRRQETSSHSAYKPRLGGKASSAA